MLVDVLILFLSLVIVGLILACVSLADKLRVAKEDAFSERSWRITVEKARSNLVDEIERLRAENGKLHDGKMEFLDRLTAANTKLSRVRMEIPELRNLLEAIESASSHPA